VQFTRFLEPAMLPAVQRAAGGQRVQVKLFGGYPDAERVMAAFYDFEEPSDDDFPLRIVRLTWNAKFSSPEHRDLLGAVMGLGIERETTGDIAPGTYRDAPCAYLFALEEMADYIAASLDAAGRAALKVTPAAETPELTPPEGVEMRLTVQQERLDAVLAAACRLSRSEAQRLIAAGLVKLNHAPTLRGDARLEAGDLISARGFGRIAVTAFQGESRRGRRIVQVFKYGK
jgi:RNA-binding protein YlmH